MSTNQLHTLLCPPGEGVYTVHTGKKHRQRLQQCLYPQQDPRIAWQHSLQAIKQHHNLLMGICSDTGGGILRGANWGPLFVRRAVQKRHPKQDYLDIGDVRVIPHLLHDKYLNQDTIKSCRQALYGDKNHHLPVSPLSITEAVCHHIHQQYPQHRLFSIGGDHSVSYPLVKAFLQAQKQQHKKAAVIHFDAHTDLLVDRLGIDLCFGSWAYHILPYLNQPSDLIQIGIRASAKDKNYWQQRHGITQYWAKEIQIMSAKTITEKIIAQLQKAQIETLYISFDIDAIDARYVSATGTPEPNGLEPEQVFEIIQMLKKYFMIGGGDMVEVAPLTYATDENRAEDQTLKIAADSLSLLMA